jgi:cyclopropane fatty-acyl-phospholipid synthase-like methyltransferase
MMERQLEPELMDDPEQVVAYARANFESENQGFVDRFGEYFPDFEGEHIVDLGCGPGDIPLRFARAYPGCRVTGVDASRPMLDVAERAVVAAGLSERIELHCERIESFGPTEQADAIISNSLLHHLPHPLQFWHVLRRLVKPGGAVLVMDLLRPESPEEAQAIVETYAANEAPILKRDFYHSLLASFTEDEVAAQLTQMNLTRLLIDVVDDRHWIVGGRVY